MKKKSLLFLFVIHLSTLYLKVAPLCSMTHDDDDEHDIKLQKIIIV